QRAAVLERTRALEVLQLDAQAARHGVRERECGRARREHDAVPDTVPGGLDVGERWHRSMKLGAGASLRESPSRLPAPGSRSRGGAEYWLTRRRGGSEGAEGCFCVYGAAETSRRIQGACGMVVCSGRVGVRGVHAAAPGGPPGAMGPDSTGRTDIIFDRESGRVTPGSTRNAARPGIPPPRLRVSV